MFSFTDPLSIHEKILSKFCEVCSQGDNPLDKLTLLMTVSGEIIEEYNEYIPSPKINSDMLIALPEKEKNLFISPKLADSEILWYMSDKFAGTYELDLPKIDQITFTNSAGESFLKTYLKTKKNDKLDKYKMSFNRINFLMTNKLFNNLITNCFEEICNESDSDRLTSYYEDLACCKVFFQLKKRYLDCDRSQLKFYRPMTELSSIVSKVFDSFIGNELKRLYTTDSKMLHKSQIFYSTDAIFKACNTVSNDIKCMDLKEHTVKLILFMDIKEAYLNVSHVKLISILKNDNVPSYIIRYVSLFLKNLTGYYKDELNSFNINHGLIIGQSSSQILFNIYMNAYIREIYEYIPDNTFKTDDTTLLREFMIVYVDDIIFRITSQEQLELLKFILPKINKKYGFEFNGKSRKYTKTLEDVVIDGADVPDIEVGFAYLGGYIHHNRPRLFKWMNENVIIATAESLKSLVGTVNDKVMLYRIIKDIIVPFSFKIIKSSVDDIEKLVKYSMNYIKYYIIELCPSFADSAELLTRYYESVVILRYLNKLFNCGVSDISSRIIDVTSNIETINNHLLTDNIKAIIKQVNKKDDDIYEVLS